MTARRLTTAELLTWSVVLAWRWQQERDGVKTLLQPYPPCPACGSPVSQAGQEHAYGQDFDATITLHLRPCGHDVTAFSGELHAVYPHQRKLLDLLEYRDIGTDEIIADAARRVGDNDRQGHVVGHATIGIDVAAATQATVPPDVAGRCPACGGESLMLTDGHVTCRRLDCTDPCAVDDWLHRTNPDNPVASSDAVYS